MIITISIFLALLLLTWVVAGVMEYVYCLFGDGETFKAIATLLLIIGVVAHWGVIMGKYFEKYGLNPPVSISIG